MKVGVVLGLILAVVLCGSADAVLLGGTDIGGNITIPDGRAGSSFNPANVSQGDEDQELDMGTPGLYDQQWDFEGWFLKTDVQRLTAVAGWDFNAGQVADPGGTWEFGDVFIDVSGSQAEIPGNAPGAPVDPHYGYEYALVCDWVAGTYELVALAGGVVLEGVNPGREYSNPFRVDRTVGYQAIDSGSISFLGPMADAATPGFLGDGTVWGPDGELYGPSHYAAIFDLGDLDNWDTEVRAVHVTVTCGNESGNGRVPDGGMTLALLGMSLVGIGALASKFRG